MYFFQAQGLRVVRQEVRRIVPRLRDSISARGRQGIRADGAEGGEGREGADSTLWKSTRQSFLNLIKYIGTNIPCI